LSDNVQIGPPKLTRFERVRIVGARALQLSLGAPMLIELPPRVSDPFDIALAELKEGEHADLLGHRRRHPVGGAEEELRADER